MPIVVPVKFAFASRDLWFDPQGLDIVEGDHAICSTERGTEIGLVTADPLEVAKRDLAAPLKPVLRIATDDDLDQADRLARKGEEAMVDFRRLVKQNELDMKPVGVEFLFGGEKTVFYFAAEERVDFRQLVKDLSSCLHTRVDMRQIGVRDETRLVGGYAQCGQELCCTRFGGQFEPVSIRMAKEQDLPLNSSKISGVCGRLMCCLRYEFEAYKDFKSRAPKKKAVITTPLGKAKIQEYDTPREQLVLRLESGKVFRVNLADMTSTEENKKRCAEQDCTCRPDCVTRSVLEKIESPDIALALMELDREMGVDVGDGLDKADRIVASGPTPRRRRGHDEAQAPAEGSGKTRQARKKRDAAPAEKGVKAQEGAGQGRRRRKRSATAAPAPEQQAQATPQTGTRRRRRHLTSEERDEAFLQAAAREASQQPRGGSRRRKHTTQAAGQKPDVPSVADQVASGEVKVTRRRPGDGGGQKARRSPEQRRDAAPDTKPERKADAKQQRGDAKQDRRAHEATAEGEAPAKRRRRRRSRKPRRDDASGQAQQGGATGGAGAAE